MVGDQEATSAGGLLAGFGPGSRVGGYLLEEQIGAGGMAVVFRASDERLGRRVALKLLAPALAADKSFRQRFTRESRAAAAVDDPHIIPVYEAGEAAGVLFIAMRLVPGKDVRSLLDDLGPLPADRVASIVSQVASALDSAHAAGLVHRDVKPANMLVDARPDRPDHVYLSDFGLSKGALSSVGLTASGYFLGTPSYTAPEQIQGGQVDGRTDQYALACAAYELLTGEPPFARDHGMAVIWAHLSAPPPSPRLPRPDLPVAIDAVFARGLAKSPAGRFATCRDLAEALRAALGLQPYNSGPGLIPPPRPPAEFAPAGPAGPVAPVAPVPPWESARTVTAGRPGAGPGAGAGPGPGPAGSQVAARYLGGGDDHDDLSDITALAFQPGGDVLALSDLSGQVWLCDARTGMLIADLSGNVAGPDPAGRGVEAMEFSPDGSLLAIGCLSGQVRVLNVGQGRVVASIAVPGQAGIGALAFSPDGSRIAVVDDSGDIGIWDAGRWQQVSRVSGPAPGGFCSVRFSPGGVTLAAGGSDGRVYLLDADGGRIAGALGQPTAAEVYSVAYTPDGSVLAAGDAAGRVCLWDSDGIALATMTARGATASCVFSVAFHPSELWLAAGYAPGGVRLWDAERGRVIKEFDKPEQIAALAVAFSADGRTVAAGYAYGAAWLWNTRTGRGSAVARIESAVR